MSVLQNTLSTSRWWHAIAARLWQSEWAVPALAGAMAGVLFGITLQTDINGSTSPYVTDVGEIQNALPRWGTLHFTGYPLYSATGSFVVSLLRFLTVPPAAGASIMSLMWGALTIALLVQLALDLGGTQILSVVGGLIFAVSTSMWMDSSIAEIHTMTMFFTVVVLWLSMRFYRHGRRTDLLWLALALSQGIMHQRALVFSIPAVLVLVAPRWRLVLNNALPLVVIGLLSPLVYIYMPLREWMGADWTFGNTSTWQGFWAMILDTKADRIIQPVAGSSALAERANIILSLLADDLPLSVLAVGLAGLFAVIQKRGSYWWFVSALTLAWLPYLVLTFFVWEGGVSDAILAVKLPVIMMAGLGLSLLASRLATKNAVVRYAVVAVMFGIFGVVTWQNYPRVIQVTRDRGIELAIATADQASHPAEPTVMMALWGHSFWGMTYAQKYRGQIQGVTLVDHNATFTEIVADGNRLVTLSETFFQRPPGWWQNLLGEAYLDSYAPGLVEIRTERRLAQADIEQQGVTEEISLADIDVMPEQGGMYRVDLMWHANQQPQRDYSVTVHLLSLLEPTSPDDLLAQSDAVHPVEGWYPTSQWVEGQLVRDSYRLQAPLAPEPAAVRVTMYYVDEAGQFVNGEWITIPLE